MHSFPTRRSAELRDEGGDDWRGSWSMGAHVHGFAVSGGSPGVVRPDLRYRRRRSRDACGCGSRWRGRRGGGGQRSEEHTSELQSLMRTSFAIFCLKKTTTKDVLCG